MSGPEKGIQAERPVGTEPEDSKVRGHQDNFLVGQKTKGGLLRLESKAGAKCSSVSSAYVSPFIAEI